MHFIPFPAHGLALALGLSLAVPAAAGTSWDCRGDHQQGWACSAGLLLAAAPTDEPLDGTATDPEPSPAPTDPEPSATDADLEALAVETEELELTASAAPDSTPPAPEDVLPPVVLGRRWALCPPLPERDITFTSVARQDAETRLAGDRALQQGAGIYELHGNAVAQRADQRITADVLIYNDVSDTVDAVGNVRYDEPDLIMHADRAHFDLTAESGEAHNTDYLFFSSHARGTADTARLIRPGLTAMDQATYTTCPEGVNTWGLRAGKVELDHDEGWGVARNARLEVKDIPVLYTPYVSFPIDDRRKTGFLIPTWGTSDESGFELTAPFYWNIAPHRDATITPRYMADRGLMMGGEFRYLNPGNGGRLYGEYLDSDDVADGDERHLLTFQHSGRATTNIRTQFDINDVSDEQYLEDFGNSLSTTSTNYIQRLAEVDYNGGWWGLKTRIQNFETLDGRSKVDRPYERLPQFGLLADPTWEPFGLDFALAAELVRFDHPANDERDRGTRLDLRPQLSLPIRRTAYELTPAVTLAHTRYDLDREDGSSLQEQPSRTLPMASLDGTVFFERSINLFGGGYTQTLEPRLFYLYVPEDDQTDLPIFDSGNRTFRFRELFSVNRFNGGDRIGDANQVTLAVTSRFIDPGSGAERLRASVGQIHYLENREVTLNEGDDSPLTESRSDYAGELAVSLSPRWTISADGLWDPVDNKTEESNFSFRYRGGPRQVANLSYRFQRESRQQIDASLLWPVTPSWHVLGRWNYDFDEEELLEGLAGLEYETCCWALRFLTRSILKESDDEVANDISYMIQWELKGFTSLGHKVEDVLEDGILGYQQ